MSATAAQRAERLMPMARHDCYSFSFAIFVVLKEIETEISRLEHCDWRYRRSYVGRDARSPRHPILLASSRRGVTNRAR
jgi:hypothetical protein